MRIKEKIEILYSGYGLKSAIKEYDNKKTDFISNDKFYL